MNEVTDRIQDRFNDRILPNSKAVHHPVSSSLTFYRLISLQNAFDKIRKGKRERKLHIVLDMLENTKLNIYTSRQNRGVGGNAELTNLFHLV